MMASDPLTYLRDVFERAMGGDVPHEAARFLAELTIDQADQDRAQELFEMHREGTITPEELAELDAYVRGSAFVSWVIARSRKTLRSGNAVQGDARPRREVAAAGAGL